MAELSATHLKKEGKSMSKTPDQQKLERVAERNGFDPESLGQVILRFERMGRALRKQAVLRAVQTENWGQLDAFICLGSWVSLRAIQTLPEPLAKIPEVAATWKNDSLAWLIEGAHRGCDRLGRIPPEFQAMEARKDWLPGYTRAWMNWMHAEIANLRDTFHRLPEFLRNEPEVLSTRLKLWGERCLCDGSLNTLKKIPEDVRKSTDGYIALRTAALRTLKTKMPAGWGELAGIDSRLPEDPFVLMTRKNQWLDYLKNIRGTCSQTPEKALMEDAEVYQAWRSTWVGGYNYPSKYLPAPPPMELSGDQEVHSARRNAWIRFAGEQRREPPSGVPTDLSADGEVQRAWLCAWIGWLKSSAAWQSRPPVPRELANVDEIRQACCSGVVAWITEKRPLFIEIKSRIPAFLQTEDTVRMAWEKNFAAHHGSKPAAESVFMEWTQALGWFQETLPSKATLWCGLAEKVPLDLSFAPAECQEEPQCFSSWREGWLSYIGAVEMGVIRSSLAIPNALLKDELVQRAVKRRWLAYISDSKKASLARLDEVPASFMEDSEFVAIRYQLWNRAVLSEERCLTELPEDISPSKELRDRYEDWRQLPENQASVPAFQKAWKRLFRISEFHRDALEHLVQFPNADRNLVRIWQNAADPRKRDVHNALLELRRMPWNLECLSEHACAHPLVETSVQDGMLELIQERRCDDHLLPCSCAN
jgi:hypothetical protein